MSKTRKLLFDLTKEIESLSYRRDTLNNFDRIHHDDKFSSNIGYIGRGKQCQFMGYLLINDQCDIINKKIPIIRITPLDKELLDSFSIGNNYIRKINSLCLAPLLELLPEAYEVVDPYWYIDQGKKFYTDIEIRSDKVDSFIKHFHTIKPFELIKSRLNLAPDLKRIGTKGFTVGIHEIKKRIAKAGLGNCPKDLFEFTLKSNMKSLEALLNTVFLALVYLNSSIQCIDQLLFQKFTTNKLISLDENKIYNISKISSNAIGKIYELCITDGVYFSGEIIHTSFKSGQLSVNDFCFIEGVSIHFSQDFGNEIKVNLRVLDDNFSAYGNILSSAQI